VLVQRSRRTGRSRGETAARPIPRRRRSECPSGPGCAATDRCTCRLSVIDTRVDASDIGL